jgi:hypothetical protein
MFGASLVQRGQLYPRTAENARNVWVSQRLPALSFPP